MYLNLPVALVLSLASFQIAGAAFERAIHQRLNAELLLISVALDHTAHPATRRLAIWSHFDLFDARDDRSALQHWAEHYAADESLPDDLTSHFAVVAVSVGIEQCTSQLPSWDQPVCPPPRHDAGLESARCIEQLPQTSSLQARIFETAADAYDAAGQPAAALRLRTEQLLEGYDQPPDRLLWKLACDFEQAGAVPEADRFYRLLADVYPDTRWGGAARARLRP